MGDDPSSVESTLLFFAPLWQGFRGTHGLRNARPVTTTRTSFSWVAGACPPQHHHTAAGLRLYSQRRCQSGFLGGRNPLPCGTSPSSFAATRSSTTTAIRVSTNEPSISILALSHDTGGDSPEPPPTNRAPVPSARWRYMTQKGLQQSPGQPHQQLSAGTGHGPQHRQLQCRACHTARSTQFGAAEAASKSGPVVGYFKINGGTNSVTSQTITLKTTTK